MKNWAQETSEASGCLMKLWHRKRSDEGACLACLRCKSVREELHHGIVELNWYVSDKMDLYQSICPWLTFKCV